MKLKSIILVAIGVFLANLIVPTCGVREHDGLEDKILKLENSVKDKDAEIESLNTKLASAEPYFKMNEAEKEAMKIETAKKEEENKIEQERLAQEKKNQEEEKRQAELDAKSVTLGNGTYLVGTDIPEGVYDLFAVKGGGNVQSSNLKINLIMGTIGDSNFYQREQQNVELKEGTKIDLSRVTVKFVPDDK